MQLDTGRTSGTRARPGPATRLKRETAWFAIPLGLLAAGCGLLALSGGAAAVGLPASLIAGAGALGLLRALVLEPREGHAAPRSRLRS